MGARVIGVVAALSAFAAPQALAANGVHVDPGSPAGKQYAIPITSARDETSGHPSGRASASPPLFGVGVTPSAAHAVSSTATSNSPNRGSSADRHRPLARGKSAQRRRSAARAAAQRSSSNVSTQTGRVGGSSWLPLVGGGVLVLLLGCGGGFALRRRA